MPKLALGCNILGTRTRGRRIARWPAINIGVTLHTWTGKLPTARVRGRSRSTRRHMPGVTLGATLNAHPALFLPAILTYLWRNMDELPLTDINVCFLVVVGTTVAVALFTLQELPLSEKASTPTLSGLAPPECFCDLG